MKSYPDLKENLCLNLFMAKCRRVLLENKLPKRKSNNQQFKVKAPYLVCCRVKLTGLESLSRKNMMQRAEAISATVKGRKKKRVEVTKYSLDQLTTRVVGVHYCCGLFDAHTHKLEPTRIAFVPP